MAILCNLQRKVGTFGDTETAADKRLYLKAHWSHLDGKPSTYNPAPHDSTHDAHNDARYLGKTAKAADSDKLDGYNHDAFGKVTPPDTWLSFTDPLTDTSGFLDNAWTNKFDFFSKNYISQETSSDGINFSPTTEYTDAQLQNLVGGDGAAGINIPNLGTIGTAWKRFTFTSYSYVSLSLLYLYVTRVTGSLEIKVEKRQVDTWTTVKDYSSVGGWPAHIALRHTSIWFNPSTTSTGHHWQVRITIKGTTTNPSYINHTINKLQWWGGYPSGKRTVWDTDKDRNVSFPSELREQGQRVYSPNNKPSAADIGALSAVPNDHVTNERLANVPPLTVKGRVSAGTGDPQDLTMEALKTILTYAFSDLTSHPTTLADYGITDAKTATEITSEIATAIANLVASSPETLDTLNELAAALGDDPNFATTITNALAGKVPVGRLFAGLDLTADRSVSDVKTALNITLAELGGEPSFTKNSAFNKNFGNLVGTVCQGNDARLSDARTPLAHTQDMSTINGLVDALNAKVATSREIVGLPLSADITEEALKTALMYTANDVGAQPAHALLTALAGLGASLGLVNKNTAGGFTLTDPATLGGTVNNITMNGVANQNPSFYAPIAVGTDHHILYSNGSGAPSFGGHWGYAASRTSTALTPSLSLYGHKALFIYTGTTTRTVTISPNSSQAFPIGTEFTFINYNTGGLQIACGSGVTVNGSSAVPFYGTRYKPLRLIKVDTDAWVLEYSA